MMDAVRNMFLYQRTLNDTPPYCHLNPNETRHRPFTGIAGQEIPLLASSLLTRQRTYVMSIQIFLILGWPGIQCSLNARQTNIASFCVGVWVTVEEMLSKQPMASGGLYYVFPAS